jgi:integrase
MPKKANGTTKEIGKREPGFETFARYYKRRGTQDAAIEKYAGWLGSLRTWAGKPLLQLDVDGVEALDEMLLTKGSVYRTVLKMFYRGNKRSDLDDALPRQNRPAKRKKGIDDVLMPDDVVKLIEACGSARDRALLAVLAATGARISEVCQLRLKDVKLSNGTGYQMWFGQTKVRGEERYSPKIEGAFKKYLDDYLAIHPSRNDLETWLFPSTARDGQPVHDSTIRDLVIGLAKKAGITKDVNPHAFRHARVTWGVINGEDTAKLSIGIWGRPVSTQMNRYTNFAGLDMKIGEPTVRELPPVPALPLPLNSRTAKQVNELTAKVERIEEREVALQKVIIDAMRNGTMTPELARLAEILLTTK